MTRRYFQYHPVIGHTYIPGLRGRLQHESGGVLIRVNSSGFRCERDFTPEKPADTFRVLVFGDSFTAGYGVRNEARYTDLLEDAIPGIEVYNFGLDGTGPDQQYLIFREFAAALDYDLLVIAPWVENISRSKASHQMYQLREDSEEKGVFPRPYFTLGAGESLELRHVPVPHGPIPREALPPGTFVYGEYVPPQRRFAWLRRQVLRNPHVAFAARRLMGKELLPEYRSDAPGWVLLRAILRQWIRESAAPVIIAPVPMAKHIEREADPQQYLRRFRELEARPHVTVHDFAADLSRYPAEERRGFRFPIDIHPTPAGHQALARSLEPVIRQAMLRASEAGATEASSGKPAAALAS